MGIPDLDSEFEPRHISPTTGLPLPLPVLSDGDRAEGSPMDPSARTALYYQENAARRQQIWDNCAMLERADSELSDYSTPRGNADMEQAFDQIEPDSEPAWWQSLRSHALSLASTVAALSHTKAALTRQPSAQEEGESNEQRWKRLGASQTNCEEWWEHAKLYWERARAIEQQELDAISDGAAGESSDEVLRLNVTLRDGQDVQVSLLSGDSVQQLISRAACEDRAPHSLLELYFCGVQCARENSIGELGAVDEARLERFNPPHIATRSMA